MVDESTNPNSGHYGGGAGLAGAIIQVGGALYDSWRNREAARENTDKTIAAQKAEAELAYQRSMQQWNMQNAYNTPQAQMQRFAAAGLNPNLIYGQGSGGNASSPAPYQPANLQYRYEAPAYGAALQSVLPLLMDVGTWMQNMRMTETEIQKKSTDTERARQLIDYLTQANPKLLSQMDNKLSLFPYQRDAADYQSNIARTKLFEMEQDFRYKFGDSLFGQMGSAWQTGDGKQKDIGGLRKLQYLQEQSKTKLLDAKASWSDFDITDPQGFMQMLFSGVMGLAGQTIRLSTHRSRPQSKAAKAVDRKPKYNSAESWRQLGNR